MFFLKNRIYWIVIYTSLVFGNSFFTIASERTAGPDEKFSKAAFFPECEGQLIGNKPTVNPLLIRNFRSTRPFSTDATVQRITDELVTAAGANDSVAQPSLKDFEESPLVPKILSAYLEVEPRTSKPSLGFSIVQKLLACDLSVQRELADHLAQVRSPVVRQISETGPIRFIIENPNFREPFDSRAPLILSIQRSQNFLFVHSSDFSLHVYDYDNHMNRLFEFQGVRAFSTTKDKDIFFTLHDMSSENSLVVHVMKELPARAILNDSVVPSRVQSMAVDSNGGVWFAQDKRIFLIQKTQTNQTIIIENADRNSFKRPILVNMQNYMFVSRVGERSIRAYNLNGVKLSEISIDGEIQTLAGDGHFIAYTLKGKTGIFIHNTYTGELQAKLGSEYIIGDSVSSLTVDANYLGVVSFLYTNPNGVVNFLSLPLPKIK